MNKTELKIFVKKECEDFLNFRKLTKLQELDVEVKGFYIEWNDVVRIIQKLQQSHEIR